MSLWGEGKTRPAYKLHCTLEKGTEHNASGITRGARSRAGGLASPKKVPSAREKNLVFAAIPTWTHKMRQTLFLHGVPLSRVAISLLHSYGRWIYMYIFMEGNKQ
uniref:Uncharacterized protein n=1 Tax=Ixodes ricinus TaxID=34613 RepID=V5IHQ7_IXORI